jgi:hypothetical protein
LQPIGTVTSRPVISFTSSSPQSLDSPPADPAPVPPRPLEALTILALPFVPGGECRRQQQSWAARRRDIGLAEGMENNLDRWPCVGRKPAVQGGKPRRASRRPERGGSCKATALPRSTKTRAGRPATAIPSRAGGDAAAPGPPCRSAGPAHQPFAAPHRSARAWFTPHRATASYTTARDTTGDDGRGPS